MSRSLALVLAAALSASLALACAGAPRLGDPDRSGVWGYLRLVPHAGVEQAAAPYADRRYADAELVDYSRTGFAVVHLEGPPGPPTPRVLRIRSGLAGLALDPPHAALAVGAAVEVENATDRPRVVTCPDLGIVRALEPGRSFSFALDRAGGIRIFVPGDPGATAHLFASPGPFSVVDASGRYELLGLEPGAHRLRAWHPRFPPVARELELGAGRVERHDIEMGVGLEAAGHGGG